MLNNSHFLNVINKNNKKLASIKMFFFLNCFILNFITLLYKRITIRKYSLNHLLNFKKNVYQSFPKA